MWRTAAPSLAHSLSGNCVVVVVVAAVAASWSRVPASLCPCSMLETVAVAALSSGVRTTLSVQSAECVSGDVDLFSW